MVKSVHRTYHTQWDHMHEDQQAGSQHVARIKNSNHDRKRCPAAPAPAAPLFKPLTFPTHRCHTTFPTHILSRTITLQTTHPLSLSHYHSPGSRACCTPAPPGQPPSCDRTPHTRAYTCPSSHPRPRAPRCAPAACSPPSHLALSSPSGEGMEQTLCSPSGEGRSGGGGVDWR